MEISYAITVKDEIEEISNLIPFLLKHKQAGDEVVVLYDNMNGSPEVEWFLRTSSINNPGLRWHNYPFDGHFDRFKNHLTALCKGDFVINIDADEIPTEVFMENINKILESNNVDMIRVPRINTVKGLTEEHIQKWGWSVNERGWVNFPDLQSRIYANNGKIRWKNKVHEVLEGYLQESTLPLTEEYAFIHNKTIGRQEKQNRFYAKIETNGRVKYKV